MTFTTQRPLALVTGASSGIGLELARQFAEHGYDLIIAAENGGLAAAAAELERSGANLETVTVDLTKPEGVEELYQHVRAAGRPLEAAALNAGIGDGGAFATDTDLEKDLELVDLNVRSVVHLAKYVARDMAARGQGRILFTSSIASTMPGPFHAVYNASKSFVQSFALALRGELRDKGVSVTSLMPGATDTDFFDRADLKDTILGSVPRDDPAQVARQGFDALMAGAERVVAASAASKMQGRSSRFLPDSAKAAMHKVIARPGSGGQLPSMPPFPSEERTPRTPPRRLMRVAGRLLGGVTTAVRSLPIRASTEDVEQRWREDRTSILQGIPADGARLSQGPSQGDWGTTWTIDLDLDVAVPRRLAGPMAGKAVRRLKALAETGEIPTTSFNPSYRRDAGQEVPS